MVVKFLVGPQSYQALKLHRNVFFIHEFLKIYSQMHLYYIIELLHQLKFNLRLKGTLTNII